jgi:iron(III) transport system ATP-binding protein
VTILTLDNVSKRYGPVTALDEVSLSIDAGERAAIVGPSGSGKTTLLRLIAGFEAPDAGRIVLNGRVLADGSAALPAHRREVGVVLQDGALFPHLSVADNIGFGLPRWSADRAKIIAGMSDMVGLDRAMLKRRPDALSGGQQQRVALARALVRRPKLMLLDEPFSALDTGLRASIRNSVAELLRSAGVTTVLVTHDQNEALSFADHLVIMDAGRILQAGSPRELYFRPKTAMIATFLGDAIILPGAASDGWACCPVGRIKIGDPKRRGHVELMLRPEQFSLSTDNGQTRGKVISVEFSGPFSIITLRLTARNGAVIVLRHPSSDTLAAPGDEIGLSVKGAAHCFPINEAGGHHSCIQEG